MDRPGGRRAVKQALGSADLPKRLAALGPALAAARRARSKAYAPYSGYRVGAALITRRGRVFDGCNVENATYGATLCAERSAVAAMVRAGDHDPVWCIVVTGGPRPAPPCGICRQVLAEFARDMRLLLVADEEREGASGRRVVRRASARLGALFPHAFRLK
jgi:cytidine deaminase